MKILGVIQCRINSVRLHEKALALIGDKPMIAHVVERAKQIKGLTDVVIAVPTSGDKVKLDALNLGVDVVIPQYGVSENDVLGRFRALADRYIGSELDGFMRITADCWQLDPKIAEAVLEKFIEKKADYCTNVPFGELKDPGYVDGSDVEVFSREALMMADKEADSAYQREHVCPWMIANLGQLVFVPAPKGSKGGKTSIDTKAELEAARG